MCYIPEQQNYKKNSFLAKEHQNKTFSLFVALCHSLNIMFTA